MEVDAFLLMLDVGVKQILVKEILGWVVVQFELHHYPRLSGKRCATGIPRYWGLAALN